MVDEIIKVAFAVVVCLGLVFAIYIIVYVIVITSEDIRDFINDERKKNKK